MTGHFRWLVNQGRDEEALVVLSNARRMPKESDLVQIEFLEIKAQHLFEQETAAEKFPQYQDGSWTSNFKLGLFDYLSLLTSRSKCWALKQSSVYAQRLSQLCFIARPLVVCEFLRKAWIDHTANGCL